LAAKDGPRCAVHSVFALQALALSAKNQLRFQHLGVDQIAHHFGLTSFAVGNIERCSVVLLCIYERKKRLDKLIFQEPRHQCARVNNLAISRCRWAFESIVNLRPKHLQRKSQPSVITRNQVAHNGHALRGQQLDLLVVVRRARWGYNLAGSFGGLLGGGWCSGLASEFHRRIKCQRFCMRARRDELGITHGSCFGIARTMVHMLRLRRWLAHYVFDGYSQV
jgi:hypothetical protein